MSIAHNYSCSVSHLERKGNGAEPMISDCVIGLTLGRLVTLCREATQGQYESLVNESQGRAEPRCKHFLLLSDLQRLVYA